MSEIMHHLLYTRYDRLKSRSRWLLMLLMLIPVTPLVGAQAAGSKKKPPLTTQEKIRLLRTARKSPTPLIELPTGERVPAVTEKELATVKALETQNSADVSDDLLAQLDSESNTGAEETIDTPKSIQAQLIALGSRIQSGVQEAVQERKFTFTLPVVGTASVQLMPDPLTKQIRLNITLSRDGKQIIKDRSPVILNEMQLSSYEHKLTGKLHKGNTVNVFGADATFRLKKLVLAENGDLINKAIFSLEFKKSFKTKLPGINGTIEFKKAFLTLQDYGDAPVVLTARVTLFNKPIRLMLFFNRDRVTLALQVKKLPLKSLIRATAETPLKQMQITRGRILADIWVPKADQSSDTIYIPEEDAARELRIEADLEKIPLELDEAMDDVTPETLDTELAQEAAAEIAATEPTKAAIPFSMNAETEPEQTPALQLTDTTLTPAQQAALNALSEKDTPQAVALPELNDEDFAPEEPTDLSTIETPDDLNKPDLMHPEDIELDQKAIEEALPDIDYVDTLEADDSSRPPCDLADICCREPDTELYPFYALQATISRRGIALCISASDLTIPKVGTVQSATIMMNIDREASRRDDLEVRPDLKQKTLKKLRTDLIIQVSCLPIKHIGYLEDGMISMELQQKQREKEDQTDLLYTVKSGRLHLVGTMRLKLPKLGKIPIIVDAILTKKGLMFTGKLDFCESWNTAERSETGYTFEKTCKKNNLRYKGLSLDNVRITYGNPPLNAAEQAALYEEKQQRLAIKEAKKAHITAAREIRAAQLRGEEVSTEELQAVQRPQEQPSPERTNRFKREKALTITATTTLWGIKFIVTLMVVPAIRAEDRDLVFSAKGIVKNFKPFKYIPGIRDIQKLRDVTMNELSAEIQWAMSSKRRKPMPTLKLMGAMALFGTIFRASCKWVVDKKGVPGLFIYTPPQKQQALSDLIPLLNSDFFRNITCCNSSIAISTVSGIDTSYFTPEELVELAPYRLETIRKGLLFMGDVPLSGSLERVGSWLGIVKKKTDDEKRAEQLQKERDDAARARGETVVKNRCQTTQAQFRMLGNINVQNPSLSEFRIGIGKNKLKQFSSTAVRTTTPNKTQKTIYSTGLDSRFSTTALNPFNTSKVDTYAPYSRSSLALPTQTAPAKRKEPLIELDGIELFILGDVVRPSFGAAASILVRPTQNINDLLALKGAIEFGPTTATLGAQMLGTWRNAFSLRGWDLSNVAIILGFLYGSIIPTKLGGAAKLDVKKDFSADFKFMADADVTDMGFEGTISKTITLLDLIKFTLNALDVKLPSSISNLPMPLELYNTNIRYAPTDIRIGDQWLEAGFGFKTEFNLLGKNGKVDAHVNGAGLKALGTIEQINFLNLLKIAGSGGKGNPIVDIEASFERQKFLISGYMNIADIAKADALMELSASGFHFDIKSSIGETLFEGKPLLAAQIIGQSSGPIKNPQFKLSIDFQNYFADYIRREAIAGLKTAEKEVESALNAAQNEINTIASTINKADKEIQHAEAEVAKARSAVAKIAKAKEDAVKKIDKAQDQVNTIRKQIEELDRWYRSLPAA